MTTKAVHWMCSWCGKRTMTSTGRPHPGTCPRKGKTKDGRTKPHTWIKNN